MNAIQKVVLPFFFFFYCFDSVYYSNQYLMFYDCVLFFFSFILLCSYCKVFNSTISADKEDEARISSNISGEINVAVS